MDVAIGIGRFAEGHDEFNQGDDAGDAGPAEQDVEDALSNPAGIEFMDAQSTKKESQHTVNHLVHDMGANIGCLFVRRAIAGMLVPLVSRC